ECKSRSSERAINASLRRCASGADSPSGHALRRGGTTIPTQFTHYRPSGQLQCLLVLASPLVLSLTAARRWPTTRRSAAGPVFRLPGHFVEEPAGNGLPRLAPLAPREGHGHREFVLRPGHADVAKPPLLGDLAFSFFQRSLVGEDSLLHPHQVDERKLEPLGAMQGHQGDRIARELLLL